MRLIAAAVCTFLALAGSAGAQVKADRIVVEKAGRSLTLYRGVEARVGGVSRYAPATFPRRRIAIIGHQFVNAD